MFERVATVTAVCAVLLASAADAVAQDRGPAAAAPASAGTAEASSGHVGQYVHSQMELAAGLWLKADGTFEYWLTVGALDETATGRWSARGNRITLANDHKPVPPTITAGPVRSDPAVPLKLQVVSQAGRGVAGIDLLIGFDDGKTIQDYTQEDGWTLPGEEAGEPRWVAFSMTPLRLQSPRFPIDRRTANALTFVLVPNDLGVVDMAEVTVTADADGVTMVREGQPMHFVRRGR